MTIQTRALGRRPGLAYGLHLASAIVDGAPVEATGSSAHEAERILRARLSIRCDGCSRRGRMGEGEAKLSRRTLGSALCHQCRETLRGPEEL